MDAPAGGGAASEDFRIATGVTPSEEPGRYRAEVPPSWNVPSGMHGGVFLATALQAGRAAAVAAGFGSQRLRSAHASFTARPASGALDLTATVRRSGRTTSHVDVSARGFLPDGDGTVQPDEALAVGALFCRDRDTADFLDVEPPAVPGPDDADSEVDRLAVDTGPLTTPPLFDNLDFRRAAGLVPWDPRWAPGAPARYARWGRYHVPPLLDDGTVDPLALLPMADLPGPSVWTRFSPDEPLHLLTSLELTVHFLEPVTDEWVLADFRARWMADGYVLSHCDLWSADRLVATSEQFMLVRAVDPDSDF